jgi:subtilase family serine protease
MRRAALVARAAVLLAAVLVAAACSAPAPARPGRTPAAGASAPAVRPRAHAAVPPPASGLTPAQLAAAYDLGPLRQHGIDGAGQTIVIVDSFGSPTIAADLASFDAATGLPPPASLRIIQPAGRVPAFRPTSSMTGWAAETSLDVEWAHAMAPAAGIVLVETPVAETEGAAGFPQIVTAEEYVLRHHLGGVISQSFGATEQTFASPAQLLGLRGAYELAARDGVTVLAASGDNGASGETLSQNGLYERPVVEWPASDPLVTAVGGTALALTPSGTRLRPDTAWNESGGGRSAIFSRPSYQDGVAATAGARRAIPDISMDASCASPVAVYETFPGSAPPGEGPWQTSCGTSLATPLFAGIVALADQVAGHPLGLINPAIYEMSKAGAQGIVDVTSGGNTISFSQGGTSVTVPGFSAGPGYDLASGAGTVDAASFVPELAALAGG